MEPAIDQPFQIHSQLLQDCHKLCEWQDCHLLLHRNASMPWLIIVPETNVTEFHDLDPEQQLQITRLSQRISDHFKSHFAAEKINFAAIGNVVKQLHIHVIGRHPNDALWPDVVWGAQLPDQTYSAKELATFRADIFNLLESLK